MLRHCRSLRHALFCFSAHLFAHVGCAIDTVPLPEGHADSQHETSDDRANNTDAVPTANADSGDAFAPTKAIALDQIYCLQQPGFLVAPANTADAGTLLVIQSPERPGWQSQREVAADGSLVVASDSSVNALSLSLEANGQMSANVDFRCPAATPNAAPVDLESSQVGFTEDAVIRLAVISNGQNSFVMLEQAQTLAPPWGLMAANLTQGRAALLSLDSSGQVTAQSGDILLVFAIDASASKSAAKGVLLQVP